MKTIKTHLKTVALIFASLILFQGCTVYKSTAVSLDEAAKSDTKVKVVTNDNQTLKFKRVGFENDYYYGEVNFKNTWIKTRINEDNIVKIQLKDKSLSTILSIGIPIVILGILVYAGSQSLGGFSISPY